jgi:hypothetical protein
MHLIVLDGKLQWVDNIERAEHAMLQLPQVECTVTHKFSKGHYIREVFLPANTFAIGHYQNFNHVNIMLKGKVIMINGDGSCKEIDGPCTFVGAPGRKVGYIVNDTIWQNVYTTDETDVEVLEATYLTKSPVALSHSQNQVLQLMDSKREDREDYQNVLDILGFNESDIRKVVENQGDLCDMPGANYKFQVMPSPIEGKGVFSVGRYMFSEPIGVARIGFNRTVLGRYTNHAKTPNAIMVPEGEDIWLVALKDIGFHEEITIDYRQSYLLARQMEKNA